MKKRMIESGFSLVEMAIVLTIVALLLGGLLPMISGQMEQQRRTETRKQLDEIRAALIGFAVINNRLPCPANPTIGTGLTNAGVEAQTGGVCTILTGALPWVTLGTSETDAWGRRFTYAVTGTFTTSTPPFTLSTTGNLNVKSSTTGSVIATNMPAVIVSHGVNGSGAWMPAGNQLPASADADEAENSNADITFVSHDITPTYDDLVVWLSPNTLFNRMVAAGKLP